MKVEFWIDIDDFRKFKSHKPVGIHDKDYFSGIKIIASVDDIHVSRRQGKSALIRRIKKPGIHKRTGY